MDLISASSAGTCRDSEPVYGWVDCTQVDALIDLRTNSQWDFLHVITAGGFSRYQ